MQGKKNKYERRKGEKYIPYEEEVKKEDLDRVVIYNKDTRNIYDYDTWVTKKELLDLGQLNYDGIVI